MFGGEGDGLTIRLFDFAPRVTVFRNGGPPLALAGNIDADECPDAVRLGVYELVRPVGPDTTIYVSKGT